MKGFVVGILVGVALFAGGIYFYFASGMAPAAVADPPMMMERKMANKSLDAHIDKANVPAPPIQPSDDNYVAGAKLYKDNAPGATACRISRPGDCGKHVSPCHVDV